MFEKIRDKMRDCVRSLNYVLTIHAEEEMENDGLSILDVEHAILNGNIVERRSNSDTAESKYLIAGTSFEDVRIIAVAKLAVSGKMVVITIYKEKDEYEN